MKNLSERYHISPRAEEVYGQAEFWIVEPRNEPFEFGIADIAEAFQLNRKEAKRLIDMLMSNGRIIEFDCQNEFYIASEFGIRRCTMCGKRMDVFDLGDRNHIVHTFGYGSIHDEDTFEADLCIKCYDKIIDMILPLFPESPLYDSRWCFYPSEQ